MNRPYEWMAWGGATAPEEGQLAQMLMREGLTPEPLYIESGKSPEMQFAQSVTYVLVSGRGFFSIPGYGSAAVGPGDIMEINAGVFHDITITSPNEAKFLRALR